MNSLVVVAPVESVTFTTIVLVSALVGVPTITPAWSNFKESGNGSEPAFKHQT
jgi:hypothetical protein